MAKRTAALLILLCGVVAAVAYQYQRERARRSEFLLQYQRLNAALAFYNGPTAQRNVASVRAMRLSACRNGNIAQERAWLDQAQQVRARTQQVLDTLHAVARRLPGGAPASEAGRLYAQLEAYRAFIRPFNPQAGLLTAPEPGQFRNANRAAGPAWFGRYYFQQVPEATGLATLAQLEAQVLRCETDALLPLRQRLIPGESPFFGRIAAIALPESEVVRPGATYRAGLVLAVPMPGPGHGLKTLLQVGGQPHPVKESKDMATLGLVEFAVPPAPPGQPDTVRANWQARVQQQACYLDTILRLRVPYVIVKKPAP